MPKPCIMCGEELPQHGWLWSIFHPAPPLTHGEDPATDELTLERCYRKFSGQNLTDEPRRRWRWR
jgi:hypothetical protein